MLPTTTRGTNRTFDPPKNWNPETDGHCGSLGVRVEGYGKRDLMQITSTWKPDEAELRLLNAGGVIELHLITDTLPPAGLSVVAPIAHETVEVADRVGTYDEHGPATP